MADIISFVKASSVPVFLSSFELTRNIVTLSLLMHSITNRRKHPSYETGQLSVSVSYPHRWSTGDLPTAHYEMNSWVSWVVLHFDIQNKALFANSKQNGTSLIAMISFLYQVTTNETTKRLSWGEKKILQSLTVHSKALFLNSRAQHDFSEHNILS